jgi:hypothetical protein
MKEHRDNISPPKPTSNSTWGGGDIDPSPEGKNTKNVAERQHDIGRGSTGADPNARRNGLGGSHGADRLPTTIAACRRITYHAPMKYEGGKTYILLTQHVPHNTPRETKEKEHREILSRHKPLEHTSSSTIRNPTQQSRQQQYASKDTIAAPIGELNTTDLGSNWLRHGNMPTHAQYTGKAGNTFPGDKTT